MANIHYAGLILNMIRGAIRDRNIRQAGNEIRIDQPQENHIYGIQQVRIRLEGDPQIYRMIIAPADAPIRVGPVSIDQHFLEPIAQFKGEQA